MRKIIAAGLILGLMYGQTFAQEEADIEAFNAVWAEYAEALQGAGSIEARIELAEKVVAAGQKVFTESDEQMPMLLLSYGMQLLEGKDQDKTQAVLKEALVMAEGVHGKQSPDLVPFLTNLANAEGDVSDTRSQERRFKRALSIVAQSSGKDSLEYADLLYQTGRDLYIRSRSNNGKKYLTNAHEYYLAQLGEQDSRTGLAAFYLAKFEFSHKRYRRAAEMAELSLAGFAGEDEQSVTLQLFARALLVQAYESRGKSDLATEHCVAIGNLSALRPDTDYQPLFRLAPKYPLSALQSGKQGHVDFSFTVDESGFVTNAEVIDKTSKVFIDEAMAAVERFRYAPRVVDGEPVAVDGIKTRITFALTK